MAIFILLLPWIIWILGYHYRCSDFISDGVVAVFHKFAPQLCHQHSATADLGSWRHYYQASGHGTSLLVTIKKGIRLILMCMSIASKYIVCIVCWQDRQLLDVLLEVTADPVKYQLYSQKKNSLLPKSFINTITKKFRKYYNEMSRGLFDDK